jgi:transporter family-2 protein
MKYLFMLLTLLIGGLLPIQAVLNTRLGRETGGFLMGSLLSFCVGLICLLMLNAGTNTSALLHLRPASVTPWYIWLGGVLGAFFVGYITWINQQQGVALTFALVVSGQIFASLVIDHYGFLGSEVRTITIEKLIGAGLIIAGLILVKK